MANQSDMTRKEQVLWWLRRNANLWVDGPTLHNSSVGGSEGLRRLRELVADGHRIQQRRHPDSRRDIWQYRLLVEPSDAPLRTVAPSPASPAGGSPTPSQLGKGSDSPSIRTAVTRDAEGRYEYVPIQPGVVPQSNTPKEEEPPLPQYKFQKPPAKLDFGQVAVCPRCHARTKKRGWDGLEGLRHKDPYKKTRPCLGCDGWGIVPNMGPVAVTMPEGMS